MDKKKGVVSVFYWNINQSEKNLETKQQFFVQKQFLLEGSAVIAYEGDYQFLQVSFIQKGFLADCTIILWKGKILIFHATIHKARVKAAAIML